MTSMPLPAAGNGADASVAATKKDALRGPLAQRQKQERGSAFGALLNNAAKGNDAAKAKPAPADKTGEKLTSADPQSTPIAALEMLLAEPSASEKLPADGNPDGGGSIPSDTTITLSFRISDPAQARTQATTGKEARAGAADIAALSSALADAARGASSGASGQAGITVDTQASGPALPNQDIDLPMPEAEAAGTAALAAALEGSDPARMGDNQVQAPIKISVIHQETHLPPVQRNVLLAQIAEPIREAAAELGRTARGADADPSTGRSEVSSPTKLLHIELHPAELGSIVVKMRLTNERMEMRIEASNSATATMLARDEAALKEIIRASGYAADSIVIETMSTEQSTNDRDSGSSERREQDERGERRDSASAFDDQRQPGREPARDNSLGSRVAADPASPSHQDEPHDLANRNDLAQQGRSGGRNLYL